jgi:hypothetical protein
MEGRRRPAPSCNQEAGMSRTHDIDSEGHEHVPMEEARAGETTGRIRIVLIVSSILAIVVLGIVLFTYVHPAAQS